MPTPQIILVTGANRGIGFSIVQATALRIPAATYLVGSRTQSAGEEAVSELQKLGVTASLEVLVLDVTSNQSIVSAVDVIKEKHGRLDGLFSFLFYL